MGGWKFGLWLIVLLGSMVRFAWAQEATVSPVQVTPASAVQVPPTPEQDYNSGVKSESIREFPEAMEFYHRAADAGHGLAQVRYADLLRQGLFTEDSVKYFRLAADQGNKDGQYGLGVMYRDGEGVKRDYIEARKWFTLAGDQGQEDAIRVMAMSYMKGRMDLDEAAQQSPEALAWIKRAADLNYLPALDALGAAYRAGQLGLEVNIEQADAILAKTNKIRGIVAKEKPKKSALFRLLKGDEAGKDAETKAEKKADKKNWKK